MADEERDIMAKTAAAASERDSAPKGPAAGQEPAALTTTPDTCGLQLECPVCGWRAEGIRCVRCGALKLTGCGGSCGSCGGCPALG
jgi:hypothetical protein